MRSLRPSLACPRCSQSFTKRSSLVRHSKRCLQALKAPSRQRACQNCANSKLRCDLQRPLCSRCQNRTMQCEYRLGEGHVVPTATTETQSTSVCGESQPTSINHSSNTVDVLAHGAVNLHSAAAATNISNFDTRQTRRDGSLIRNDDEPTNSFTSTSHIFNLDNSLHNDNSLHAFNLRHTNTNSLEPETLPSPKPIELTISDHRRDVLLGGRHNSTSHGIVTRHTAHFVSRVLKSWLRMMATHHTKHLPPIIHRLQLSRGIPTPLANCFMLVKMWAGCTDGTHELVQNTIYQEVRRLLRECPYYDDSNILAAAQSLVILLIVLFFGLQPPLAHSVGAQLIVDICDVKNALAKTGLFLKQESSHTMPPWREWAVVSAKRRTILAFHHVEWSWSIKHGYPILTCFELGPLPAPAAKYLWQETHEGNWKRLYEGWLRQWVDGGYRTAELFHIGDVEALDERSDMWLAEVDEFGMMLMAEVNGVSDPE